MTMKLKSPALRGFERDATEKDIRAVVSRLWKYAEPFAVLQHGPRSFMQVFWTPKGYQLEYQEGGWQHHYQANRAATTKEAIEVLLAYLRNDSSWRNKLSFESIDPRPWPNRICYRAGNAVGRLLAGFSRKGRKE